MRITAIALGLVLGGTVPLVAQEERSGAPQEGIKVHGHWTIEVREPDGRLVTHREFENALTNGQRALAQMMTHALTAIAWQVLLGSSPDPEPCLYSDGGPTPCVITEPSFPQEGAQPRSINLQVALGPDSTVILTGSIAAARSTSIRSVSSRLYSTAGFYSFTGKQLATPVPVAAGQIIQVTVLFSFS